VNVLIKTHTNEIGNDAITITHFIFSASFFRVFYVWWYLVHIKTTDYIYDGLILPTMVCLSQLMNKPRKIIIVVDSFQNLVYH